MTDEPTGEVAGDTDEGPLSRLLRLTRWPVRRFEQLSHPVQDRLMGLVGAVPTGAVLATALWLDPDPSGMGTHKQLGLGGCTVLTLLGIPCPMCGMTTTFTHLAHLELLQGTLNQPFGLILFSITTLIFAVGLSDLLVPRQRWRRLLGWVEKREGVVAITLLVGLFAGWLYKIALVEGWLPWLA